MAAFAVAVAAFALGAASATAGDGQTTVDTFPVSFVLTSDGCPNLAHGTVIEGSGTETSVTVTKTDAHGTTTESNRAIARGTATDQHGGSYAFFYFNEFRVANSHAHPDVFTGRMVDTFTLGGHGPAHLSNGFVADITTDLATFFTFDPISSFGDPIDFATGAAICDPL
jgi:hypothetical protein